MTRALLALLLLPAPAFATMTWNPSYDPKFVAAAHAGLTAPLLLDIVCAGPACGGGGGGISAGTNSGDFVWTGKHTWGSAADAANSVRLGETAGAIVGEGATVNTEETVLAFGDATADNTLSLTATSTGVTASAATGSVQFADDDVLVCGSADFTKCLRIETDGFTAANTRVMTPPNQDFIVAGTNVNQTFSQPLSMSNSLIINNDVNLFLGQSATSAIQFEATNAPDTVKVGVGAANSWHVTENGDINSDFANGPAGTGNLIQPAWILQSEDVSTTQYTAYQSGAISTQRRRTLTEAGGAEELFRITTATLQSGGGEIDYKIHATDGTDFAVREGKIRFVFYNNAGTVTATISGADETADGSVAIVSAGETLTYALTVNVATANVFIFLINIDSNITVNAAHADYIVTYNGPGEVVFP